MSAYPVTHQPDRPDQPSTAGRVVAILGLVVQAFAGLVFSGFGLFIAFVSDSCGASSECDTDRIALGMMTPLAVCIVLFIVSLVMTLKRMADGRSCWWVPILWTVLSFGGIILGFAPEVELVSIRVLGANLRGNGTAFLGALDWAMERGIEVVNLSLSSRKEALFPSFHEVVDDAYFRGMKLVGAANNADAASYPTVFSSVFSVAAHAEPEPWRWYYNTHPPVEFGAWGVDVPIAWKDGATTVATGNSFAAPHIAGLLARMCAKHPGLTPFEAKAILAATADEPTSLGDG